MTPPVLFLLFNRPDLADRVFSTIRAARPGQLFIAVDGPRSSREGEKELVSRNRAFADRVDWPCEVHTLFRDANMGCGPGVSEAITWFFDHVESGIILEDDCLPDLSFFHFASEILERYADNEEVMMVNGTSYIPKMDDREDSYYFSVFGNIWGWASWRRAWARYDYELSDWPANVAVQQQLQRFGPLAKWHINRNFRLSKIGVINTWDYQWEHAIWASGGIAVTPFCNLVTNLGFDERATHTSKGDDGRSERIRTPLAFPLKHPDRIEVNKALDLRYRELFLMSPGMLAKAIVRKLGSYTGLSRWKKRKVYQSDLGS